MLSSGGVHELTALDIVLHRDPRVGVPEKFGSEERALRFVDDGGDRAAEAVRGHILNPGFVHHLSQETADVVRRVRSPHTSAEQQRIRVGLACPEEARSDRVQRERWQRDAAN